MSDTNSKIEKRKAEARKRQAKLKRREKRKLKPSTRRRLITGICIVLVCILAGGLFFTGTATARRVISAVKIGDVKVSSAEYSYYYRTAFSNYYTTMASYFGEQYVGIDLTKPLSSQKYSNNTTYADYFSQSAIQQLTQIVVLSEEAKAAGFSIPEEDQASVDSLLQQIAENAESQSLSLDKYVAKTYGKGMNYELLKKIVEREYLANAYRTEKIGEPTYDEAQLESYYAENKDQFAMVDIRYQAFNKVEATDSAEGKTIEEAKAEAEAFLAKATDEDAFAQAALELAKEKAAALAAEDSSDSGSDESAEETEVTETTLHTATKKSSLTSVDANISNWAFAEGRVVGDKAVLENAGQTGYYVVYLVKPEYRYEEKTVNVRHILIKAEEGADQDVKDEAKAKAEEILEQWKAGAATEESFAELAKEYSEDGNASEGGLYENVNEGSMVDTFNDWIFDPSRKSGDTGIVETEYGYHVMYYVSDSDPYWQVQVENAMRTEDYNTFYEGVADHYKVKTKWLGMQLREEPY